MLTRQRRQAILTLVDRRGAVTAAELADAFGVAGVTIRRDLIDLAGRGLLRRVHGGALRTQARTAAPAHQPDPARRAIAGLAAATVRPGSAIALSAGPITLAMAGQLPAVGGLTVVTNSVPVATAASQTAAQPALVLIGGETTRSGAHVGPLAHAAIRSVHVQTLYLDVHGVHPTTGFTAADLLEADIDRALVRCARRIVVLAHHSSWGRVGIRTIAALDLADVVITDDRLPPAARTVIAGRVGRLLVASSPGEPQHHPHAAARQAWSPAEASPAADVTTCRDGRLFPGR